MTTHEATTTQDVIDALARFRTADTQMHQRVRVNTSLGENELRILQLLLRRQRDGGEVRPSEIARDLGISSASTTALLDRLERQGSLERVSHPTDRRSVLIAPTERAERDVADLIDAFDEGVATAADELDDAGRSAVLAVLSAATAAADDISA